MKIVPSVLPAAAILGVVVWNASLWRENTMLQRQNHELGAHIRSASGSVNGLTARRPAGLASNDPNLHWKEYLGRLGILRARGELGDLPEIASLLRMLSELSADELVDALGALGDIVPNAVSRSQMEDLLADALVEKDPQRALATFADRLQAGNPPLATRLAAALGKWARKDPDAAANWLDQRITEGALESRSLDGKSAARLEFEAELLEVLLLSDVDAARQRVASLPENHRREVLERIGFAGLPPAAQLHYASVARELVPADELGGVITHLTSSLMTDGGFPEIDALLGRIQASPAERAISARQAAFDHLEIIAADRTVTRADLEPLRQWLGRQAPDQASRVTAEALAEAAGAGGEFTIRQAAGLVGELHQESGDDALIEAFLRRLAARSNSDAALLLLDRISDPGRRSKLLEEIQ